ncbi:BED-type domain-containing protein [Heracleum sosnowskyi]|uniref:BED-type domain-containing protein n=1 Tax=Heracleum sosnowskyi TaxID=360622 RepID=A0AAD8MST0_9APIA|nr:BED-type domain-containing protein [Heracleum sosnowskyi]
MATSSHQTTDATSTPTTGSSYIVIPHNHKAPCWENYDLVKLFDGTEKARHRLCGKLFGSKGNSTLSRHHPKCESKQNPEFTQARIDETGRTWNYDQVLQREMQMKCIISRGWPYNTFDNYVTTRYIHRALQPRYQKVSRSTTRRDAGKGYMKAKRDIIRYFNTFEGKFSLTSDVWSAGQNLGLSYICITCHWIDPIKWEMSKRIICFELFELPHTGQYIYQLIMSYLREFKIKDKIMSLSFDNASNNDAAIGKLKRDLNPFLNGEFFHSRCACHVLNRVVQDGLKMVLPITSKIRQLVSYCYGPNKRRQDFCKFVRGQGLKYLKPAVDMPIRWNSTYKMLKRAFRQRGVLMEFHNSRNGPVNTLSSTDWTRIEELLSILKCFYKATKRFSGVYYPTTPLVLGEFYLITMTFVKWQDNEIWGPVIFQMREKFLKYYEEMPQMFCCAAALDPKIGVDGVESLIECINCNLGISTDATSASIQKFNQILNAFYDHYETLYGAKPRDIHVETGSSRDVALQLAISRKKSKTISSSSELAKYKMTDFVGEQSDILEFWKTRSCHYPVMAIMARDILTVQASTVASESAFSFSGRILNERRSRLSPSSLEVCICYKDHLDAEERIQDVDTAEDSSSSNEEFSTNEEDSS